MTALKDILSSKGRYTLGNIPRGAEGYALARLWQQSTVSLIYIAASDRDMEQMQAALAFFAADAEVLFFPAWDCLPYDRASPNASLVAERLVTLSQLAASNGKRILLTTINAALQRVPSRDFIKSASLKLGIGDSINQQQLVTFLVEHGYRRTATAMEAGEFAVRGNLIDIISPGTAGGVRLDMFGDVIESIRSFASETQITTGQLMETTLVPASEVVLNDATIKRFRERFRECFGAGAASDPVYEAISEQRSQTGMEHLLPLFFEKLDTLFDFLPGAAVVMDAQSEMAYAERRELINEYYAARRNDALAKSYGAAPYRALPPEELYISPEGWDGRLEHVPNILLTPFAGTTDAGLHLRASRSFFSTQGSGEALFEALRTVTGAERAKSRATVISCYTNGSRERIASMLQEHAIHPLRVDSYAGIREVSGKSVGLIVLPLEHGFEAEQFICISEQDLFGDRVIRSSRARKKPEQIMAMAANFMPGELVVHREHGIGRFEGLVTLEVQGAQHDCLKILYKDDDKLFLPVENIDLVSRYGTEEETSELDKLGSASWQARKARLKERISIAAEELIKIAAARALQTTGTLTPPQGLYEEFCARFPYPETEDQANAIEDVLGDIGSGRPTDRLVCGDVGFGKTEVAMRAAFVAASANNEHGAVQVAIICPTTLLCRQHFKTFSGRFAGLPFTVRQLSRLTTPKQNKETLEGLENGKVNIVIGTHALLGKSLKFKNLGLLIIDEEQHFGVAQKEKLKALRADIHVLTLTATPIPRTLQLALTGVRELSIIATPPVDRLAVRTFVTPFDPVVLREAILREFHRGGKIFYVTPRIEHMAELVHMLREVVPEIRTASAHGQMPPKDLDRIMNDFYEGKFDLLLSTSIVESGLDIPSANTIIIDRAHMFGLAQLYQMRGRVGRSKVRAYAYFTLPHHRTLSRNATRRLEVMQTLDSLGAGFTLASHDMDIRGFGNLLGDEQSGHVREVGIELYQQMLEEAVARARSQKKAEAVLADEKWSPQINLGMTVLIPETYVQDLELRLTLYRRAASLATEEDIHAFTAELVDRFGAVPEETAHLLSVVRLKQLCLEAGVERIDAGPKGAVLSFRNNHFAKPEKLLHYISKNAGKAKIRPDQKLVLIREWGTQQQKISDVHQSIAEIARLAA